MIHQENQMIHASDLLKAVITFCLFLLICMFQLADNSPKIKAMAEKGVKVPYPYYNTEIKGVDLSGENQYRRGIEWWVQDLGDVLIPILLMWIVVARPNLYHFGFNIGYMWIVYFALIAVDRKLFLGKWPFGYTIEVFCMMVQLYYTSRLAWIYFKENIL